MKGQERRSAGFSDSNIIYIFAAEEGDRSYVIHCCRTGQDPGVLPYPASSTW